MKRAFAALLILTLIGLSAVGGGFFYVQSQALAPGTSTQPSRVFIEQGLGVNTIAQHLHDMGLIRDPVIFRLWARYTQAHTQLRAGEYDIPAAVSVDDLLTLLKSGKTVVHKLTIAEGLSVSEALMVVQDADALSGEITSIPDEGQLLPETYHFSRGDRRDALIARMRDSMDDIVMALWDERPQDFILSTPDEVLVLASIIEKETGIAEERPKIAGVFLNRLRKGMRLQSDPTVVYALTQGSGPLGRGLTRKDLQIDSPYNTYKISGLPPTPIANPGRDAIRAVIYPEHTNALYFVADGTGGHVFAKTLNEHNRNVAKWRKIKREMNK